MARFIASPAVLYDPAFMAFSLMAANTQAPGKLLPDGRLEIAPNVITPVTGVVLTAFLNAGGDVEDAPVFIKMSTATYAGNVPANIHERSYLDENDLEVVRKWSEWKDATHTHLDAADGDKIVPGNSWGYEFTSAELKALLAATGYTLYLDHEVNALLPPPSTPE
ncbi:MAG: hypothetical protein KDA17_04155 [Candidatus Saccharibacteria bacterium]|nr:hypothetical protein [Candidatus Saccharibacteria bacterium]